MRCNASLFGVFEAFGFLDFCISAFSMVFDSFPLMEVDYDNVIVFSTFIF